MTAWYSSFSTGFGEVDAQHYSLDLILQFMMTCGPALRVKALKKLTKALKEHFAFEEEFMVGDQPFVNDEHHQEHRRMEETVANKVETMCDSTLNDFDFGLLAFEISGALVAHVTNFDIGKAPPKPPS
jgi:hemerythrin